MLFAITPLEAFVMMSWPRFPVVWVLTTLKPDPTRAVSCPVGSHELEAHSFGDPRCQSYDCGCVRCERRDGRTAELLVGAVGVEVYDFSRSSDAIGGHDRRGRVGISGDVKKVSMQSLSRVEKKQ